MKKILIVEDEPDLLQVLSQHLKNNSFQVVEAGDGEEGLQKVQNEKPDLIVLDIKMPKVDGYSFIQEMRAQKEHAKIPVIMLTANSSLNSLFKIEGVEAYFTKPYDIKKLIAAIEQALSKIAIS